MKKFYELTAKLQGINGQFKIQQPINTNYIKQNIRKGRPVKDQQAELKLIQWIRQKIQSEGKLKFQKKQIDNIMIKFSSQNKKKIIPVGSYLRILKKYDLNQVIIKTRGKENTVESLQEKKGVSECFVEKFEDQDDSVVKIQEENDSILIKSEYDQIITQKFIKIQFQYIFYSNQIIVQSLSNFFYFFLPSHKFHKQLIKYYFYLQLFKLMILQSESSITIQMQKDELKVNKGQLKSSNFVSQLTYSWISDLISYGNKNIVDPSVIPDLPDNLKSQNIYNSLFQHYSQFFKEESQYRILKSIFKTFLCEIIYNLINLIIYLITATFTPILTYMIIQFIENRNKSDSMQVQRSIQYFVGIILLLLIKGVSRYYFWFRSQILGQNMSNGIQLLLYHQTLNYSLLCKKRYSYSDVINFNQTDIERIQWLPYYLSKAISTPLIVLSGIIILYIYIGYQIFLSIIVIVLSLLISAFVSNQISKNNAVLLKKKEITINTVEETFNFIRFVKINFFQGFFKQKLKGNKEDQIKTKLKLNIMQGLLDLVGFAFSSIILSITLASFIIFGQELSTAKAFTIIVIFQELQQKMIELPIQITQTLLIWQSLKRIQKYLQQKTIDQSNIQTIKESEIFNNQYQQEICIKIVDGTFKWESAKKKIKQETNIAEQNFHQPLQLIVLKNINLEIKKGKITMIIGNIGQGKSSLLYAILNEMIVQSKQKIKIKGSIAFSAQKPLIIPGTIKQNILFYSQFDQQKFKQVLYYSSLEEDLKNLQNKQQTQIGQKGVNLSGGQKARISLARVLYSDRDIFLLDDILSAVDIHVGQFIMKQTIKKYCLNKQKTILMPTHAVKYLKDSDQIIGLERGEIVFNGTYNQIKNTQLFNKMINNLNQNEKINNQSQKTEFSKDYLNNCQQQMIHQTSFQKIKQLKLKILRVQKKNFQTQQNNIQKKQQQKQYIDKDSNYINKLEQESAKQLEIQYKNIQFEKKEKKNDFLENKTLTNVNKIEKFILEEEKKNGLLKLQIIKNFIGLSGGYVLIIIVLAFFIGRVCFSFYRTTILQKWCNDLETIDNETSIQNLLWFLGISILQSLTGFFAIIIVIIQCQTLSVNSHFKITDSLLSADLNTFFYRVPSSRIINRFSRDIGIIDLQLISSLKLTYVFFFSIITNIALFIYAYSLYAIIPFPFIFFIIWKIRQYYLKTKIECTRFQSITNSAIIDSIMTSMYGASTIRAFSYSNNFFKTQTKNLNISKKIKVTKLALDGWFTIRILIILVILLIPVLALCFFTSRLGQVSIGIIISSILPLCDYLRQFMYNFNNLQNQMISVERISQFIEIKPQAFQKQDQQKLNYLSQSHTQFTSQDLKSGNIIQFKNVALKYLYHQENILERFSLEIKQGQKIAILGRTGTGKSTIFNSLIKVIHPHEGKIFIKGKNIIEFSIQQLRSNLITFIDQQSVIFNGTFKQNLDPFNRFSQDKIMQVINMIGINKMIQSRGGLESAITNQSLSAGQNQLLSICRAFLKRSEIILIDEATASIDVNNDELVQNLLKKEFVKCTVITIAHRISTIQNSDKIIILGKNCIQEYGTPQQLLNSENSIYKKMIQKSKKQSRN